MNNMEMIKKFNDARNEWAKEKSIAECLGCKVFDKCRGGLYIFKSIYASDALVMTTEAKCVCNTENVDHPKHYSGANECIDVMRAMFGDEAVKHFCMCNAYKYRFRAGRKNGEEDIKKAEWYETYLIKMQGEK